MRLPIIGSEMKLGTGLAVGAATVLLAPVVLPVVGGIFRTLSKAGIKGGLIMYERGKLTFAEARETFDDLAAEAKAEMNEEQEQVAAPKKKKAAAASK